MGAGISTSRFSLDRKLRIVALKFAMILTDVGNNPELNDKLTGGQLLRNLKKERAVKLTQNVGKRASWQSGAPPG